MSSRFGGDDDVARRAEDVTSEDARLDRSLSIHPIPTDRECEGCVDGMPIPIAMDN